MIQYLENGFQETMYEFVTPSGLKVIGLYRPNFTKCYACLGTSFGGVNLTQKVNDEIFNYPQGVAHFLEHKLFEDEKEDILSQFFSMGAQGNAFTSYFETIYYFSHNFEVEKPLRLLLEFVRKLNISEESVDKEKGIILEELRMYDHKPMYKLLDEIRLSVYHNYPIIYDILGTEESIKAISKQDLKNAYQHNYNDTKLTMVIISDKKAETIQDIVLEYTSEKKTEMEVVNIFDSEPLEVARERYEFTYNTKVPKCVLAYKFQYNSHNVPLDKFKLNLILESNFSDMNPKYQTWLDEEIISQDFSFDMDMENGIGVIYFADDTFKYNELEKIIKDIMKDIKISEEDFIQLLNRKYGNMIFSLADNVRLGMNVARYALRKQSYFDSMEDIKKLKYEEVLPMSDILHKNNYAFVVMTPKKDLGE